jgi:hypothetical protein
MLLTLYSNLLRLTVQCGNPLGSTHMIFVNGVNLLNFTVPAATATFIPDQFQATPVLYVTSFYTVEFRSVIFLFEQTCRLLVQPYDI